MAAVPAVSPSASGIDRIYKLQDRVAKVKQTSEREKIDYKWLDSSYHNEEEERSIGFGGTLDLGAADRATKHALNTSAYGITVVALQIDYLLQKPAINLTDLALRECRIGKNYVALKKSTGRVPETSESTTIQVHVYGNFVDHSTSNGSINDSDPEVRNRIHPIFFMQKSEYGLVLLLNESGVTIHAKDGEKYCRSVNNLIDQMLRRQIWVTTKATIPHPYGTWGNSAEEIRKGKLISGELKMQSEISGLDLMNKIWIPGLGTISLKVSIFIASKAFHFGHI